MVYLKQHMSFQTEYQEKVKQQRVEETGNEDNLEKSNWLDMVGLQIIQRQENSGDDREGFGSHMEGTVSDPFTQRTSDDFQGCVGECIAEVHPTGFEIRPESQIHHLNYRVSLGKLHNY